MRASEWGEHGQFEHLLASQQRELRSLVERRYEFDEDDFVLTLGDGSWAGIVAGQTQVPVILYEPESFFFSLTHFHPIHTGLDYVAGGHAVYYKPGQQVPDERHMQLEWGTVCRRFDAWLGYIARELDFDCSWNDDKHHESPEEAHVPAAVSSSEPEGDLAPAPSSALSASQRVVKWLINEKQERGVLWAVIGFVLTLILSGIALL